MDDRSPNQFESNRTWAWCVGALVVVLNFWYDWHHPLGYLFDAIILVVIISAVIKRRR